MAEQANWYVVHTYSGYENKVAQDLMTIDVYKRQVWRWYCVCSARRPAWC